MSDNQRYTEAFWDSLKQIRTGLIGVASGNETHALPMTAHFEEQGDLYFYAPADGELVAGIEGSDGRASFYYVGTGHDLYATIHGRLRRSDDADARRRFWSDEVERWFPGQRDSDTVAFLAFAPERGDVWLQSGGATPFALDLGRRPVDQRSAVSF